MTTRSPTTRTEWPRRLRIVALLTPAIVVVGVLFGTGVAQALAQSFGYLPFAGDQRWSLNAYGELWSDPAVRASMLLTARIAIIPTFVAAALGVAVSTVIRKLNRSRGWVTALVQTNLAVPHLVAALCTLLLLSQGGLLSRLSHLLGLTDAPADFPPVTNDSFGFAIMASYVWKETPFLTLVALAALGRGIDELTSAATTLGAGRWQRWRFVTLPLIAPSVTGGAVLVFAFAAGSYEVPYLLGRPYPAALPVVALQYYRDPDLSNRPVAMAAAVLLTVLSGLTVAVYLWLAGRLSQRAL